MLPHLALSLLVAPQAAHIPAVTLDTDVVSIPLEPTDTRPIVMTTIDGKGPFPMIVDTGTMFTVLDTSLADDLELDALPMEGEMEEQMAQMGHTKARVSSITLGEDEGEQAHFGTIEVFTRDLQLMGVREARGILGLPLFRNTLMTLDTPRRVLELSNGSLKTDDLAFDYEPMSFASNDEDPDSVHGISLEVRVADTKFLAHLDTGSGSFLILPREEMETLELNGEAERIGEARTPMGNFEIFEGQLADAVQVGALKFDQPRVRFGKIPGPAGDDAANLGMGMLGKFALSVDQRSRRLRIVPSSGGDTPPMRTLGINFSQVSGGMEKIEVTNVLTGSTAERVGLEVGDVLVAVAGEEMGTRSELLFRALAQPEPFDLTVRRDGVELTYEIAEEDDAREPAGPDILLDRMRGERQIKARMRRSPDGPFREFEGSCTWSDGHWGRYTREQFSFPMGQRSLEGEVFLGANRDGGFELVQVDNGNPNMIHVVGAWDPGTQTLSMESITGRPLLWMYRLVGENDWTKEMYSRNDDDSDWSLMSDYLYVPAGQ